jgi:hypothetical protein
MVEPTKKRRKRRGSLLTEPATYVQHSKIVTEHVTAPTSFPAVSSDLVTVRNASGKRRELKFEVGRMHLLVHSR